MKIMLGVSFFFFFFYFLAVTLVSAEVKWPQDPPQGNLAHASLKFGWNSYKALKEDAGKNVFFSPYSITNALSMLVLGSTGMTEVDLLMVLSAPEDISTEQMHEELQAENTKLSLETNATIGVANRFFVEETVVDKVLPKFSTNLRNFYNATVEPTPFASNPADARKEINDFVSASTHGELPQILKEDLPTRTKMSLVNAIYFKGLWTKPFNPVDTMKMPFHAKDGDVEADFMLLPQRTDLPYAECDNGDCQVVILSYTNTSKYAMIAIVPKEGLTLESLEANLDHEKLRNVLKAATDTKVNLKVPRFSMKNRFELKDMLNNLGATNIFGVTGAENSKIFSEAVDNRLVDDVIHEAKVEVNEEGTTAAGGTASLVAVSLPLFPPKSVNLNRPFLFLIADMSNGFVLFWGRVENPTLSA